MLSDTAKIFLRNTVSLLSNNSRTLFINSLQCSIVLLLTTSAWIWICLRRHWLSAVLGKRLQCPFPGLTGWYSLKCTNLYRLVEIIWVVPVESFSTHCEKSLSLFVKGPVMLYDQNVIVFITYHCTNMITPRIFCNLTETWTYSKFMNRNDRNLVTY